MLGKRTLGTFASFGFVYIAFLSVSGPWYLACKFCLFLLRCWTLPSFALLSSYRIWADDTWEKIRRWSLLCPQLIVSVNWHGLCRTIRPTGASTTQGTLWGLRPNCACAARGKWQVTLAAVLIGYDDITPPGPDGPNARLLIALNLCDCD